MKVTKTARRLLLTSGLVALVVLGALAVSTGVFSQSPRTPEDVQKEIDSKKAEIDDLRESVQELTKTAQGINEEYRSKVGSYITESFPSPTMYCNQFGTGSAPSGSFSVPDSLHDEIVEYCEEMEQAESQRRQVQQEAKQLREEVQELRQQKQEMEEESDA